MVKIPKNARGDGSGTPQQASSEQWVNKNGATRHTPNKMQEEEFEEEGILHRRCIWRVRARDSEKKINVVCFILHVTRYFFLVAFLLNLYIKVFLHARHFIRDMICMDDVDWINTMYIFCKPTSNDQPSLLFRPRAVPLFAPDVFTHGIGSCGPSLLAS